MNEAVRNLKGFELEVSLETPLMPEPLLRELNPMTVTVCRATGLPPLPLSQAELQER